MIKLDLSNNLIETIELNTFKQLPELETLDLSNNKIVYLSNAVFSGLKSLKSLILKSNLISNLVPNQFSSLSSLELLDLALNRISNIDATNFINLKNLKTIQLEFNPLERIANDTFRHISDVRIVDLKSKLNKDWFNFDNNDICLLKDFKCKTTKILLSTEQNCNCFLFYVNLINVNDKPQTQEQQLIYNDNTQFLKNCDVTCNHENLLSKCFIDTNTDYTQSCLYNVLYPSMSVNSTKSLPQTTPTVATLSTTNKTLLIESTILNSLKTVHMHHINAVPSNDDQSNLKTSASNNFDYDIHKNYVPSVRTLELKNLVQLSIFLSCLSLVLLFLFSVAFGYMHSRYRKHAAYNIVPRLE